MSSQRAAVFRKLCAIIIDRLGLVLLSVLSDVQLVPVECDYLAECEGDGHSAAPADYSVSDSVRFSGNPASVRTYIAFMWMYKYHSRFCPYLLFAFWICPMSIPEHLFVSVPLLATFFSISLAFYMIRRKRRNVPYPPGPKRLPIIGNLLDVPRSASWVAYTEWSKTYGDVLSVEVLGQVVVVLSSVTAARELLDKRGNIYSDRPVVPFIDLMKWNWMVPLTRYDEHWRMARRVLERGLRTSAVMGYRALEEGRVHDLLKALISRPDDFIQHIRDMQGAIILSIAYGYEVKDRNDRYITVAQHTNDIGSRVLLPGAELVNTFPFLRYLPAWFPGTGFKDVARLGHDLGRESSDIPFEFVKKGMADGTAQPSVCLENLQELDSNVDPPELEIALRDACGSIFIAGADTTVTALETFFLALVLFPCVQARAQAELDAVVGRGRLPCHKDRDYLPYVQAVCMELLRWRIVLPLALPHVSMEDDIYKGYRIPKGAIVFANVWAILHDPTAYPDPDDFKPERFIGSDGRVKEDPVIAAAFGFGKRICPGRYLVDSTVFSVVSKVLHAFNVTKAKDAQGHEIPVEDIFTGDTISHPLPFQCSIKPRSQDIAEFLTHL